MFFLTKSDKRAVVILTVIATALLGYIVFFDQREPGEWQTRTVERDTIPISLRPFDPNTVDSLTLLGLGLRPGQIRTFLRYRSAGAIFRQPSDIKRVHTFSEADIDRLIPYVTIDEELVRQKINAYKQKYWYANDSTKRNKHWKDSRRTAFDSLRAASDTMRYIPKFRTQTQVDINTADSLTLIRIPGIGSVTASRILRRRQLLGAFHSTDMLLSIKYFKPEFLQWLTIADSTALPAIKRININTATFTQLLRFPYIGYDRAIAISNYRRLYGDITTSENLRSTSIFPPEDLEKLLPYIAFASEELPTDTIQPAE